MIPVEAKEQRRDIRILLARRESDASSSLESRPADGGGGEREGDTDSERRKERKGEREIGREG